MNRGPVAGENIIKDSTYETIAGRKLIWHVVQHGGGDNVGGTGDSFCRLQ